MNGALLIGMIVLGGITLGWILHHQSVRQMTPILRRLAAETNGVVKSQGPFVMPKLVFSHHGTDVELSSASTGISGESIRYTYVLFNELASKNFEFRIRPRSLQAVADEWAGFRKPMTTQVGKLKKHLVIYTNDNLLMEAVFSERIQADLLFWASGERENRISDIRNYDDKLIYAVTGTLNNTKEFKLLLDSACNFFDEVNKVVSSSSRVANNM